MKKGEKNNRAYKKDSFLLLHISPPLVYILIRKLRMQKCSLRTGICNLRF